MMLSQTLSGLAGIALYFFDTLLSFILFFRSFYIFHFTLFILHIDHFHFHLSPYRGGQDGATRDGAWTGVLEVAQAGLYLIFVWVLYFLSFFKWT